MERRTRFQYRGTTRPHRYICNERHRCRPWPLQPEVPIDAFRRPRLLHVRPGTPFRLPRVGCAAVAARAPVRVEPGRAVLRPLRLDRFERRDPLAERASVSRETTRSVVTVVVSVIGEALASDETVAIAGFGTFSARSRPARRGRNPRTGESIAIAASRTPAFKAGKTLRDQLNAKT